MKAVFIFTFFLFIFYKELDAQSLMQNIKGNVIEKETQLPLPGASISIINSNPIIGTTTDFDGNFTINEVPVGRYNIKISFIGYQTIIINELLVNSAKEVVLKIEMTETANLTKQVTVKADKSEAINSMAMMSARQFTVEEASRYAGGYSDPARLASSFAGVSGTMSNNGIVIRGNAPKGLLWRFEGVEISNPSHFANMGTLGAGAITALSSLVLDNSDFFTGAFPAEYGNALSGVFDLRLRNGNKDKRESAFQVGLAGIDFSSEGPFCKDSKSSYLFNYRYSTFGLLSPILPPEMGKLKYQDLSFKLNFPTNKIGTFSFWGIGALDYQGRNALNDTASWESDIDKEQYSTDLFMGAVGVSNKSNIGDKAYLKTNLALSGNGLLLNKYNYNNNLNLNHTDKINNNTSKVTFNSNLNYKFNSKHSNKTGINIDRLQYNMFFASYDSVINDLNPIVDNKGYSYFIHLFSQSKITLSEKLDFNIGIHYQLLTLNNRNSFEPRVGFIYKPNSQQNIGISYGLHSQMELLNFYFTNINGEMPNKNLDFSKSNHLILSYEIKLNSNSRLKIEPYYQYLFKVPVIPNSYYSLINLENEMYFNDSLVNKGSGKNYGIDITYEKFFSKGIYYLLTASLFDSKYTGGDNIERNTRFNKNYVINILGGKEWAVGKEKNNLFSFNLKLCAMGGDKTTPINEEQSYLLKTIVEDTTKAFSKNKSDAQVISISIVYRKNKLKHSSVFEFSFINLLGYKELTRYYFDKTQNKILKDINQLVIPNLSYRIEF